MLNPICPEEEVLEGEIKLVVLADKGKRLALYNINGAFYATDDICTHEHASLSEEGMIDGYQVICGWHLCGFDIATGATSASPCSDPLQTYPVVVVEGVINVEL